MPRLEQFYSHWPSPDVLPTARRRRFSLKPGMNLPKSKSIRKDSGTDFSNGTGRWIALAALTHIALRCRTRWLDSMTLCVINGCAFTSTPLNTKTHLVEVRCVFNGTGRWIRRRHAVPTSVSIADLRSRSARQPPIRNPHPSQDG